jgi:hypothetical protein
MIPIIAMPLVLYTPHQPYVFSPRYVVLIHVPQLMFITYLFTIT